MRNFAKVVLGAFTGALRRKANQPHPTRGQVQEFNKAIRCVCSMTDFYLMTQYDSHTDKTISYMQEYLRGFHNTKDVFLRFRAGKGAKKAAAEAHKNLLREQSQASSSNLTMSEKAKMHQANTLERRELVDDILKEGAHYNFPKMHLISHDPEQIPKFGALGQFYTEISECMYKSLKDAYRRSNKVNVTSQIITNHTQDHTFIMKDLPIKAWAEAKETGNPTQHVGKRAQVVPMYLKLQGKLDFGTVSNLGDLERVTGLCDLVLATRTFLRGELGYSEVSISRVLSAGIRAYEALEIPVPKLNGEGFVVYHARCTGLRKFRREQSWSDWVWVRKHQASEKAGPTVLNRHMPARLNALYKLGDKAVEIYRLAHVMMLQAIGGGKVEGPEGMLRVGWPTSDVGTVLRIGEIEGMVHLIPLEPNESWLVHNRIDLETWNMMYD